jgi:beta-N-acetylhexosaminidase
MMKRFWRIWLAVSLLFSTWMAGLVPLAAVEAAQETAAQENETAVDALFNSMSVADRVGQLFLVTFAGDAVSRDNEIVSLILEYRIGGVVLLAERGNITGYGEPANAPAQVAELANELQRLAILGATAAVADPAGDSDPDAVPPSPTPRPARPGAPLFIAITREGDGYPNSQILNGLTEIPNNMAIGATWQPAHARAVGEIVGRELSALGINMLLGPSLDVLEKPAPLSPSDLGARVFGGNPYWVGRMGQAYTAGVHAGSNGRMAVIAKHFPGNGSSDRPIDEEVPTVRRSLEQLEQSELAPFFAVTGGAGSGESIVDGLLITHVRYQGFQGNAPTAPISFDPAALNTLLQLPPLAGWRQNGGLTVSEALGVRAVERYYDETEQEFPHRRVAKDALLAGNDLLYLGDFVLGSNGYETQVANIKDTILWFREKYETDPSFQQRVDEAVRRILALKLRLYNEQVAIEDVLVDGEAIPALVGQGQSAMLAVAQAAITLISPSPAELVEQIASPPGAGDKIVIFTDVRQAQQCAACPFEPLIGETALASRILALYGPNASGQVQAEQIHSFSFDSLEAFLAAGSFPIPLPTPTVSATVAAEPDPETEEPTTAAATPTLAAVPPLSIELQVQAALQDANWIIFAFLDSKESPALNQFLAERTDIVRNARVIVFAYNAPYYLDTTEISKLTAYFGVYSKIDAFIDASVRVLFQELPLTGASPVNIEGINYDLAQQTQPDPQQVIELFIVRDGEVQSPSSERPLNGAVGDTLRLQTGIVRDSNGQPVPDGALVQFIQRDRIQGTVSIIAEAPTVNGVAQLDYLLEARTGPGQFRIVAAAGNARQSQEVDIIIEGAGAAAAIITPTPMPPTATPTPTASPTPTETPTVTPTAVPVATPDLPQQQPVETLQIQLSAFRMLAAVFAGLVATGGVSVLFSRQRQATLEQQVGWLLWGLAGGLLLYNYFALGLPGTAVLHALESWAGLFTTLTGGMAGLLLYQWRWQRNR